MATSPRLLTWARLLLASTCVAGSVCIGLAADWPVFTAGRWHIDRTMSTPNGPPTQVSRTECMDPTADQRAQREMLSKAGCQFSPLTQTGSTYRFSATCKMGGITSTSTSVIEARGADAYTVTVDSVTDGAKSHEVLTARRVGACTK